jgi:hypothetical protein
LWSDPQGAIVERSTIDENELADREESAMSRTFSIAKKANLETIGFGTLRWVNHPASFDLRYADQSIPRNAASWLFAIFEFLRDKHRRWRCYRMTIAALRRYPGLVAEFGIAQDNTDRIRALPMMSRWGLQCVSRVPHKLAEDSTRQTLNKQRLDAVVLVATRH